jgi:hypothetical protein
MLVGGDALGSVAFDPDRFARSIGTHALVPDPVLGRSYLL